MSKAHDAVVVGAGHNGLVAANVLADAGWDVLVLEADTDAPGGAVFGGSAEVTAPGYLSDPLQLPSIPWLGPVAGAAPPLELERHGLAWREHTPDVLAHLLPDGAGPQCSTATRSGRHASLARAGSIPATDDPLAGAPTTSGNTSPARCSRTPSLHRLPTGPARV